jgi:endonuclease YncB( thermonuclease family)
VVGSVPLSPGSVSIVLTELLFLALTVVSVADGDTLVVADGEHRVTLRLAEIDAPERTQPYSQAARRNLLDLCKAAKSVRFEPVATDRYGRTVAHVWCDDVHVNWSQVEAGLAWCFLKYLQAPDSCLPREESARAERRGLWREPNPTAPWTFREMKRGGSATPP